MYPRQVVSRFVFVLPPFTSKVDYHPGNTPNVFGIGALAGWYNI